MSLYTKYRPKDWDSVIWQDFIVKILKHSLENNSTGHAYILTGSRGTGKTTSARILAKSFNCTNLQNGNPCHECENCKLFDAGSMPDLFEIDAASNTWVDNVRDIIEESEFLPISGKYKIYIIDEVHMLSRGAFNALLKTLEEPPSHVKFILATTEIEKVPETIRSRAQRFDFRKISEKNIIERLKFVTDSEGIKADAGSLEMIAKLSRGGMRDALTLLEQFNVDNHISFTDLKESFSLIDDILANEIIETLFEKKYEKLREILGNLRSKNINSESFFETMIFTLRNKMIENISHKNFQKYENIFLVFRSAYASIKAFSDNFLLIEMTLLQAINARNPEKIIQNFPEKKPEIIIKTEIPKIEKNFEKRAVIEDNYEKWTIIEPKIEKKRTVIEENKNFGNISHNDFIENSQANIGKNKENNEKIKEEPKSTNKFENFSFRQLLNELKNIDGVVLATLKNASFKHDGEHLELSFASKWNADKMQETRYQSVVVDALNSLYGGNWSISSVHKAVDNNSFDDIF